MLYPWQFGPFLPSRTGNTSTWAMQNDLPRNLVTGIGHSGARCTDEGGRGDIRGGGAVRGAVRQQMAIRN